jgi:cyclase
MLTARVIPCLDTVNGRVVKGVRFRNLRDAGDPVECAARYEQQGADELVLLDVAATPEARAHRLDTVRAVRAVLAIPLTVGGGVRSAKDATALLEAGADKVAVNTAAVARPELLTALAQRFGSQCVVLAIDAAGAPGGGWCVVVESGSRPTVRRAVDWAREAADRGAGELLLTSVDRDGTRSGYDLELVSAVSRAVGIAVIASGGANTPGHLAEALLAGADAVLAASIFHDGDWTVAALKDELAARGVRVRRDRSVN